MRASVLTVIGWPVLAGIGLFALARLSRLTDRSGVLCALESLWIWVLLPEGAVLGIAASQRRWPMVAVAAVLVCAHLVAVGPDIRWWPTERREGQGPVVRVAAANVLVRTDRSAEKAAMLRGLDADVLAVLELNRALAGALEDAESIAVLPHRFSEPMDPDAFGAGIYSRHPLTNQRRVDLSGIPFLTATVALPGGDVDVVAVHTTQPLASLPLLQQQLAALGDIAGAAPRPLLMLGDFNATRQHRPFRQLLARGLTDAHLARGRGLARTWPVRPRVGLTYVLIDHVLVSRDLVVGDVGERTIPGSDHRAVVATIRRA